MPTPRDIALAALALDVTPEALTDWLASREKAPDAPAYLTIEDAARRLRVCHETVRRMVRARAVRAVKIGSQWRIPADSLPGM